MDFSTGSGSERPTSSGGSGQRPGGPAPGVSAASGGEFNYRNPVQSFIAATRRVLLQPSNFFQGMNRRGDWINPIVFALVWYMIAAVIGGLIGLIFGSFMSLGSGGAGDQAAGIATSFGSFVVTILLAPIFAALILFVMAGLRHLLVMLIVGSQNAGFEATLRVQAYAFATRIVWWIPILGALVGFVYGLYLSVVGIREVHATTTGKAALVVLIPVAVALLLLAVLAALIGAAVYSLLQQQM
ncbi:MAG: YIP1 family protein [Rubrobacter sp.]|nr:YIP1 family protein [Rubrobacter sp.]